MNRNAAVAAALLIVALALPAQAAAETREPAAASTDRATQDVIVVLHDATTTSARDDITAQVDGELEFVYDSALNGFAARDVPADEVAALERDPRVAFVEEDQQVHAWNIPTGVERIDAPSNPATGIGGSAVDADIAIIDSGIASHAALNIVDGTTCTDGIGGTSCSGSGTDANGHGTHVAGTAAGIDGSAATGVAAGARLHAVGVLGATGGGSMSQIIAGVDWVTDRADTIDVANMSLGCRCTSAALDAAISASAAAGVVYVIAAGNDGADTAPYAPAGHPQAITVSAIADYDGTPGGLGSPTCTNAGPDDSLATFSNYGTGVDIAAPGVCITSTWLNGSTATISGTSMAAPHVAGAAAAYIADNDISSSPDRWEIVLDGLLADWSVPQSSSCGFSSNRSPEPLLYLTSC